MTSLSPDRTLRILGSPIAFCGALLALASLAATAFALSSWAPNSLADYVSAICSQRFQSASSAEASYMAENVDAMTKMMFDMGIRPSGDIDGDFVAMMTPHHQGAIEMAKAELRYGHNERLKRMAQEIIVTQLQEIAAMRLAVGLPLSDPPEIAPLVSQGDRQPRLRNSPVQEK
jgi:Domain of unknown function (DUF305)